MRGGSAPARFAGGGFLLCWWGRGGKGGFAPGTPALNRLRHLQNLPSRCPLGGACPGDTGSTCQSGIRQGRAFGIASSPQNRQKHFPMSSAGSQGEGGTGGDGTIRRKRRRRLRWSSPPGQGEQVPPGAPPLASPRLSRRRHGLNLRCRCHGGGRIRAALAVSAASGSFFRNGHEPWLRQLKFEKSSGGSGGLFQESPSVSSFSLPPSRVSIF